MTKTYKFLLSLIILLLLTLPAGAVSADIGPKPTMTFYFEYETDESLTIVEGILVQCEDPECLEGHPLENLGPQHFSCNPIDCSSMAYEYAGDNLLVITFSDGVTRMSNQFGKQHFDAVYTVTVYEDALVVVETGGKINPVGALLGGAIAAFCLGGALLVGLLASLGVLIARGTREEPLVESSRRWIIAIWVIGGLGFTGGIAAVFFDLSFLSLPLTILIEGLLITAYYTYRRQPRLLPATLNLAGNLLTQLVLWFLLVSHADGSLGWLVLLLVETVIVAVEAAILYWPQRRQMTFTRALGISFALNLVSFTIGLFLPI